MMADGNGARFASDRNVWGKMGDQWSPVPDTRLSPLDLSIRLSGTMLANTALYFRSCQDEVQFDADVVRRRVTFWITIPEAPREGLYGSAEYSRPLRLIIPLVWMPREKIHRAQIESSSGIDLSPLSKSESLEMFSQVLKLYSNLADETRSERASAHARKLVNLDKGYIKFVEVTARPGQRIELTSSWTHERESGIRHYLLNRPLDRKWRDASSGSRPRVSELRNYLGGRQNNLNVHSRLFGWFDHYSMILYAPPGRYFADVAAKYTSYRDDLLKEKTRVEGLGCSIAYLDYSEEGQKCPKGGADIIRAELPSHRDQVKITAILFEKAPGGFGAAALIGSVALLLLYWTGWYVGTGKMGLSDPATLSVPADSPRGLQILYDLYAHSSQVPATIPSILTGVPIVMLGFTLVTFGVRTAIAFPGGARLAIINAVASCYLLAAVLSLHGAGVNVLVLDGWGLIWRATLAGVVFSAVLFIVDLLRNRSAFVGTGSRLLIEDQHFKIALVAAVLAITALVAYLFIIWRGGIWENVIAIALISPLLGLTARALWMLFRGLRLHVNLRAIDRVDFR